MNFPMVVRLCFLIAILLSPTAANAHGGAAVEEDVCSRRLSHSLIHFALYQPQVDDKAEYCTGIPTTGPAFLVIDLVDFDLRTVPMSLQILEQTSDDTKKVLLELAPRVYPQGVIQTHPNFDKAGTYFAIVSRDDDDEVHSQFSLKVGEGRAGFLEKNPEFYLIFGLAAFVLLWSARRFFRGEMP